MQCEKKLRKRKVDARQVNLVDYKTIRTCGTEMVEVGRYGQNCPSCGTHWSICQNCQKSFTNIERHFVDNLDCLGNSYNQPYRQLISLKNKKKL